MPDFSDTLAKINSLIGPPASLPKNDPINPPERDIAPEPNPEEVKAKASAKAKTKAPTKVDNSALFTKPVELAAPVELVALPFAAIGTLYIDCSPEGIQRGVPERNTQNAFEVYQLAAEKLNKKYGCEDYRFVDYGKGAALFLSAMKEVLSENSFGDLVVNSDSPETKLVLDFLISKSRWVVRGWR